MPKDDIATRPQGHRTNSGLSIFFVLQAEAANASGLVYNREVSLFDPDRVAQQIEQRRSYFGGGYCFVVDKQIWNTRKSAQYDEHQAFCDIDSLDYAQSFLEFMANDLPDDGQVECSLLEMLVVRARYEDERNLVLVGESNRGDRIYKRLMVKASDFFGELLAATEDYLHFAQQLAERIERAPSVRATTKRIMLRRLGLERCFAAADRLRQISAGC